MMYIQMLDLYDLHQNIAKFYDYYEKLKPFPENKFAAPFLINICIWLLN